VLNDACQ